MRDMIDMAREVYGAHTEWSGAPLDRLKQLVALVRADERKNFCAALRQMHDAYSLASDPSGLKVKEKQA